MESFIIYIVWAGLILLMMKVGNGGHFVGGGRSNSDQGSGQSDKAGMPHWTPPLKDVDRVCGQTIRTDRAKSSVRDGKVYYFCSRDCRELFETVPDSYLNETSAKPQLELEERQA